jgi:hypothetical protein
VTRRHHRLENLTCDWRRSLTVTTGGRRCRVPDSGYQVVLDFLIGFLRRELRARNRSIAITPTLGCRPTEDCALHDALEVQRLASRTCPIRRLWDVGRLNLNILG